MYQETYRDAIARTWNDNPPAAYQPANAALGVVGEVTEFIDDPDPDELGDVLYYVTTLRRLLGLPVADVEGCVPPDADFREGMRQRADDLAEYVKKHVYHGQDERSRINRNTVALLCFCYHLAKMEGEDLDTVRRQNVDKVLDRYPDGFEKGGGRE